MTRVATLALMISALGATSLRGAAMEHALQRRTHEDVYYLPSPEVLAVMSMGHREAAADIVWMKALVYIGSEFEARGALRNFFRYADTIVELDPDFRRAYSWGATMGLYRPASPSLTDALRAVGYLERAATRFPDDPETAWQRAAAWSYELPSFSRDVAEQQRFREIGAEHMVVAARLGGGPAWLALTNATQLESLGRLDRAIHHLSEMHAMTRDPALQAEIEARLERMHADVRLEALRAADRDLRDDAAAEYPWLPLDFYVLVRSQRPHPSTWD